MTDTPPDPGVDTLDENLYCVECGYNLRGLFGDPIRGPECFHECSRTELRAQTQARTITRLERKRRELETGGNLCALAVVPGVLAMIGWAYGDYWSRAVLKPICITCGVIWLAGFLLFLVMSRGRPGWLIALAKYHCSAVPAMAINLVSCVVGLALITAVVGHTGIGLLAWPVFLAVPVVIVYANPMRRLSRLGAGDLERLARQLTNQPPDASGRSA